MLEITTESNYLAKVIQLGKPQKHPNADKLQLWDVEGYQIITDLTSKEGDFKIFFPVECQIHDKILSELNMYQDKELNADKTISGYVNKQRRVKAVALRGIISDGIVLPFDDVLNLFGFNTDYKLPLVGQNFDTVNGTVICNKYEPAVKEVRSGGGLGAPKKNPLKDVLIPDQFNFHYDTSKLQDNVWRFSNLTDVVVVTDKWHGTSGVFSNVLTKRKLSWFEKIKKFLGFKVKTKEYKKMYSSRSVIKYVEDKYHTLQQGYYNDDVWGKVFKEVEHVLFNGYTLYGEIVGYVGNATMVQKNYDYGCKPGEHKFLVYRITKTASDGFVEEFSWHEIQSFCEEHGLETVKELFYGTQLEWLDLKDHPKGTFLDELREEYLEKDCSYCKNKVICDKPPGTGFRRSIIARC